MDKKIMFAIFLVGMLAIGAVSAADDGARDIVGIDDSNNIDNMVGEAYDSQLAFQNENEGILMSSDLSFADLNATINGNSNATINLYDNYTYVDGDEMGGIEISRDVTIDGHGITIDGANATRIFTVTGGNVTLMNINFINGKADNGGAIFAMAKYSDVALKVIGSTFTDNAAGIGGGAIALYGIYSYDLTYDIAGSTFTGNKAVHDDSGIIIVIDDHGISAAGGALYSYGIAKGTISSSIFVGNVAEGLDGAEGGAVNIQSGGEALIEDSTFTDNGGATDYAIYNLGELALINNAVSNIIYASDGIISTSIYARVLNGGTYDITSDSCMLNATLTDGSGNMIYDANLRFTVNGVPIEAEPDYNKTSGLYTHLFEITDERIYAVNVTSAGVTELNTETGILRNIKGTYTDLFNQINDAADCTLELPYDFTYNEAIDGDKFLNGIVIDDSIEIMGNAYTIGGNDAAALFNVSAGAALTLNNVTIRDTKADKGAAVYVNEGATLNADHVAFINNAATYRGGAIYSEGSVNVDNCVFDGNDIACRTEDNDNGGAAIYNLNGTLTIANSNITNSVKDFVVNEGNGGDLLDGVVVTGGETLITDSYFANNTGVWGGAVSSMGYMNDEPYTLTVKNTKFEGNNATYGGAIYVESSELVVCNCTFENNLDVGVGYSDSGNTLGGAISVYNTGSSATIRDSTFIANSANGGGAVSFAPVYGDSSIDNCTFTDNTASNRAGAMYLWAEDGAVITVSDSEFSGNTAPWGNAIVNDGDLVLSNNEVSSTSADIANFYGVILSEINVVILENATVNFTGEILITAKVTDDNNNMINDSNFFFDINGTEVYAVFDSNLGLYKGTYTNDVPGIYVVNMAYPAEDNLIVETATLRNFKGSYTDLQKQINDTPEGGVLDLAYNFIYNAEIDGDDFPDGVLINKPITIDGNGYTISGNNEKRIFNINTAATLNNITFVNGSAVEYGGAIYTVADLTVANSTFDNNSAALNNANGGAIMADILYNALNDITLTIDNVAFTNNKVDYLGAAIAIAGFNKHKVMYNIYDSLFENNSAASDNDVAAGAILVYGPAEGLINNTVFRNNTALSADARGGAIEILFGGVLTVANSTFEDNKANYSGGAIFVAAASKDNILVVDNCTFTGNEAPYGAAIGRKQPMGRSRVTIIGSDFAEDGAVYLDKLTNASVSNSQFTGGNYPIYNLGTLALDGNYVDDIIYNGRLITTQVNSNILGNDTYDIKEATYDLTATLTDFDGNKIYDPDFRFTVNGVVVDAVPDYDATTGIYNATATLAGARIYLVDAVSANEDNLVTEIGILRNITGTFTDLEDKVFEAISGSGILELEYDFTYSDDIDGYAYYDGILFNGNFPLTINGNNHTISGNNTVAIFHLLDSDGVITFNNITFANADCAILIADSNKLNIYNCTFINNNDYYDGAPDEGGAISSSFGELVIADCVFINNTGADGGAIFIEGADISVTGCVFIGNNATGDGFDSGTGGAIYAVNEEYALIVDNCVFTDNIASTMGASPDYAPRGGAITAGGRIIIIDSNFTENSAGEGGAIYYYKGTLEISNSNFTANEATLDGGAIHIRNGTNTIEGSTFANNKAGGNPNAIYVQDGELSLDENIINTEVAEVFLDSNALIVSEINAVILDNETVNFTGEILITAKVTDDSNNMINDSNFFFDINGTEVYAVFDSNLGLYKGTYTNDVPGIYVVNMAYPAEDNLIVETATLRNFKGSYTDLQKQIDDTPEGDVLDLAYNFTYNAEIDGDDFPQGVLINKPITIAGNGYTISGNNEKRIFKVNAAAALNNITFVNGSAFDYGGAIYAVADLIVADSTFDNNAVVQNGGAIMALAADNDVALNVDNVKFTNNKVDNAGAAICVAGINGYEVMYIIYDSLFENNAAVTDNADVQAAAGAIFSYGTAEGLISNTIFTNNTALAGDIAGGGAIVMVYGGTLTVVDSTFEANKASYLGGAIALQANASTDNNLIVDNCTFTGNEAPYGAAIASKQDQGNSFVTIIGSGFDEDNAVYLDKFTDASVSTSEFTGADYPIYNLGTLELEGNCVHDIIYNKGTITTLVNATLNNNQTVTDKVRGEDVVVNATLTDDNGNAIYDPKFRITADGNVLDDIEYDSDLKLYTSDYTIGRAGEIIVSTSYESDELVISTGIYDVYKSNATLFVTVGEDKKFAYGDNVTVFIFLWDKETYEDLTGNITLVIDDVPVDVEVIGGEATYNITGLEPGQHAVMGIFDGNDEYNGPVYDSDAFAVLYPNRILSVETADIQYGDAAVINITITNALGDKEKGVVSLNISGKVYVYVVDGSRSARILNVPAGEYHISATLAADGLDGEVINDTESFTVGKAASFIDIRVTSEIVAGENATVAVIVSPRGATGTVNITVDGEAYGEPVNLIGGVATVKVSGLTAGTHTIAAQYNGDGNYNASELMEYPIAVKIRLTEDDVHRLGSLSTYGYNSSVVLVMEDEFSDATGNITLVYYDIQKGYIYYNGTVENGYGIIWLPVMGVGEYDGLPLIYSGDDKYMGLATYAAFIVLPIETVIDIVPSEGNKVDGVANVTVTVGPKYPIDPEIVVPGLTGAVDVYVDGILVAGGAELINGAVTVPVEGLAAGKHIVTVYYDGNDVYEECSGSAALKVDKADPEISIGDIAGGVGQTVEVNVTIAGGDAAGYLFFDGELYAVKDGQATIAVVISAPGMQIISVTYTGDDKYNNGTCVKTFHGDKGATSISIDGTEAITVLENAIVTVTVGPEGVTGTVNITVDGEAYGEPVEIVDGAATVEIPELAAGIHTIAAQYIGNQNYNASDIVSMNIAVSLVSTSMIIVTEDAVYGDAAHVHVFGLPEDATGTATAIIDGKIFSAEVGGGQALIDVTDLAAHEYEFEVTYSGDGIYNATSKKVEIEIIPADSIVVIDEIADVVYKSDVVVTYNIENETEVTICVFDADYNEITTGIDNSTAGKVIISGLGAGGYAIEIYNAGDENHTESFDWLPFNVLEANPEFNIQYYNNIRYGKNVTIAPLTVADAGSVYYTILDTFNNHVAEGSKDISENFTAALDAGTYTILAEFINDNYTYDFAVGSLIVKKVDLEAEISVTQNINYTQTAEVNVTMNDNATVYINGVEACSYEGPDSATFHFDNLAAGTYTVTVASKGDKNHNPYTGTYTINVDKISPTFNITNLTVKYLEDGIFYVETDVPGYYTLNINGTYKNSFKVDHELGILIHFTVAAPGSYDVALSVDETENYTAGTAYATLTIEKQNTALFIYNEHTDEDTNETEIGVYIEALGRYVDVTGNVTVIVSNESGVVKNITDDINGYYEYYDLGVLAPGKYNITAVYNGNEYFETSSEDVIEYVVPKAVNYDLPLTAADGIYMQAPAVITVILPDGGDKKDLKINVSGAVFTGDELEQEGNAVTLTLENLYAGKYSVTALFSDETHGIKSNETSFTVFKAEAAIDVAASGDLVVGGEVIVNITLPEDADGNLTIAVDGSPFTGYTVKNGTVVFENTYPAGNHTVTVELTNDSNYNDAAVSATFEIRKVNPVISIDDIAGNFGDTVEVNVTVAGGDALGFILYDDVYYPVENGQATVPVTIKRVGMQDIGVTYTGDDKYANGTGVKTFIAGKAASVIEINGTHTITVVENAVVNVTVGPAGVTGHVLITVDGKAHGKPVEIIDGAVTVEIPGLAEGSHTVSAKYAGDSSHKASGTASMVIAVVLVPVSIEIDSIDAVYGDSAYVIVSGLPEDASGNVTVTIGDKTFTGDVSSGSAAVEISDLAADEYESVDVKYSGDGKYGEAYATATVDIYPAFSDVVIDPISDVVYNTSVEVTYTVENKTEIIIGVYDASGNNITGGMDASAQGKIIITGLTAGEYYIIIVNVGDENHSESYDLALFNVNKATAAINPEATGDLVVGGEVNLTFTVPEDIDGALSVSVDGMNLVGFVISNGTCTIPGTYGAGEHIFTVTLTGDTNYEDETASVTFDVNKIVPAVSAADLEFTVGGKGILKITGPADGRLSVSVNGTDYYVAIDVGGNASLDVSALAEGTYPVDIEYIEDDMYCSAYSPDAATITVLSKKAPDMNVNVENLTVIVELPEDATGDVAFVIDLNSTKIPVLNGTATMSLAGLAPGSHSVGVVYLGDEQYSSDVFSGEISIPKEEGYGMLLDVKVTDDEAEISIILPEDIDGVVLLDINGEGTYANVSKGQAKLQLNGLENGNYSVDARFLGNDRYGPAENATSFVIDVGEITLIADDVVKYYHGPERLVIRLLDEHGEGIAFKEVKITLNGVEYTRMTDENGSASMALNLGSGNYTADVEVSEYGLLKTVNIEIRSTVSADDITKMYRNATQYYASFADSEGNPLADTSVTFNINGVFYNRTTNASGVARLNINLPAGEYVLTAINPVTGEMTSNQITVISMLETSDLTKYYRNASQFIVRVRGADGAYVGAGEEVTFNINGVFYSRFTNETGHARLNVNLPQGEYVITTEYKDARESNRIEVLPILTAEDLSMKYHDGSKFEARLVDGQGRPYAGQSVTFNINGVFYTRTTDSAGIARLNINLMAGQYIITSSYNGANIANKVTVSS